MRLDSIQIPSPIVWVICGIFWLMALGVAGMFLYVRFPASGVFVASGNLTGNDPFVYPFLPSERTLYPTGKDVDFVGQRIIGDPVYANVRTPGPYDQVTVEMEFRTLHQPLLELGLIRDAAGKELEMRPWYAEALENGSWRRVLSIVGKQGFVRNGVPDARLNDPDTRGLSSWLATSTAPKIADQTLGDEVKIPVSLRGAHDIWVVPAEGRIEISMEVQDVNRNRSGGVLSVSVSRDEEIVKQDAFGTSGSLDKGYGKTFPVKINLPGLQAGVYRVRIAADDDVFIRSLAVRNPHWVIGPRLVLGDVVGYATSTAPFEAWTASRHIVAETFHKEGLQTLSLGPMQTKVSRTHAATPVDRNDGITDLVVFTAPNRDMRIISDGFFALKKETYFQPQPVRFTAQTQPDKEGLQAVLTHYEATENLGDGWHKAKANFMLPKNAETLRFALSAPGIASRAGAVDIRKVTYTFKREPMTFSTWWRYMLEEAKNAWRRL